MVLVSLLIIAALVFGFFILTAPLFWWRPWGHGDVSQTVTVNTAPPYDPNNQQILLLVAGMMQQMTEMQARQLYGAQLPAPPPGHALQIIDMLDGTRRYQIIPLMTSSAAALPNGQSPPIWIEQPPQRQLGSGEPVRQGYLLDMLKEDG